MQLTALIVSTTMAWAMAGQVMGRRGTRGEEIEGERRGKFFGLFNIVSFPNDVCNGTSDMQGISCNTIQ